MSLGDVSRSTIKRLIEDHREAGSVPVDKLVELISLKEPERRPSPSGLYVVRLYDGMDYAWMDVSGKLSWEDAVAVWNEKTDGGTSKVCFGDIDYYAVFPAESRMLYSEE